MPESAKTRCPQCGKSGHFRALPSAPFCSPRCKMLDLSKWFGEDYVISSELTADHFEEFAELNDPEMLDDPNALF